jgi:hypothetical protein
VKTQQVDTDPMMAALARHKDPTATGFDAAWVGMEPTFQSRKSVARWQKMAAKPGGDDAYFLDRYMLETQQRIANGIKRKYRKHRADGHPYCMFARVERDADLDQWQVRRQGLLFHWSDANAEPFEARVSLDPETFEYSIKPVPLTWFYDERFVPSCITSSGRFRRSSAFRVRSRTAAGNSRCRQKRSSRAAFWQTTSHTRRATPSSRRGSWTGRIRTIARSAQRSGAWLRSTESSRPTGKAAFIRD